MLPTILKHLFSLFQVQENQLEENRRTIEASVLAVQKLKQVRIIINILVHFIHSELNTQYLVDYNYIAIPLMNEGGLYRLVWRAKFGHVQI